MADYDAIRADNQIALSALSQQLALNEQWISDTYKAACQFLEPVFEEFSSHDRELPGSAVRKQLQLDEGCALIGHRQRERWNYWKNGAKSCIHLSWQLTRN